MLGTLAMLPAALTLFFAFNAGGYFAGAPAVAAVVLGLLLVLRVTLADDPFAGFTRRFALAASALGLFTAWTLASSLWSDAPARAMIEFDRALAYWLALVLFASFPRERRWLDWAVRGLAVAFVSVCVAALVSRTLPDLWTIDGSLADDARLSFPVTYWNTLGLMAALGLTLCFHLTASEREPRLMRPLAAAALPLLAAALVLTLSRGAIAIALAAPIAYVILARPRGLPGAAVAVLPPVAIAAAWAYDAELLTGESPTSRRAVEEGGELALVVGLCVVAALVLRAATLGLDERLARIRIARDTRRRVALGAAVGCLLALVVSAIAFDLPSRAADRYDEFVEGEVGLAGDEDNRRRVRLSGVGNNGRLDQWDVALSGFRAAPLVGDGAGGFQQRWARERPSGLKVEDAHSLYIETLSELGLVGLLLLLTGLGTMIWAFASRARGTDRHVHAVLLAAGLGWGLHAGIDWDWEMPAATFWVFALGGMALAGRPAHAADGSARKTLARGGFARVALGAAVLALIATPALMALSQARLNDAADAFARGDCGTAIDSALSSTDALSVRPEPFQLIAYCDVRLGNADLAVQVMEKAVSLEPGNWESHYGLALVRAAAGRDPRRAARQALELNPRDPLARAAVRRFDTDDPREWRKQAARARLPIL